MQPKQRTIAIPLAIIAILVIAAVSLWVARSVTKTELARMVESQRTLETERDTLKTRAQRLAGSAAESQQGLADAQIELKNIQQLQQDAQQKLQALSTEKEAVVQNLIGVQEHAKAAAATSEELSRKLESAQKSLDEAHASVTERTTALEELQKTHAQLQATAAAEANLSHELGATKETLEAARARSAALNKSYEKLLKDHSKLSATDAARQDELARTRTAFEEAQNKVARLTGARGIYTVQSADSLSSIAAYFYRNGNRWSDIHKANDFLAKDPDLIYAGQVLIIPK